MAVDVSTDIVVMMWEKLFVNVATGAWSALTGLPYGELSVHPDVEAMAIATVAEAMAVARALGDRASPPPIQRCRGGGRGRACRTVSRRRCCRASRRARGPRST